MKLSENFVEVLKNFASINSGIVVKPGSKLRTISSNRAILAEAVVEEEFDSEFGIYDLNKTLGLLSLSKENPEITVGDKSLTYVGLNKKGKIQQRFTESKLILAPPDKNINVSKYDVEFELDDVVFKWISNVASILDCPHIVIKSDGGSIHIAALDVKGEIEDEADVDIEGNSDIKFEAVIKIDNIKVLPGAYTVKISRKGVSQFKHKTKDVTYWIAIESGTSSFGDPVSVKETETEE